MSVLDQGDMVANILQYRSSATPEQVEAGKRWYASAKRLVSVIADATGINDVRVCYAVAALSPRNPWRWNIADAYAFASARAEGRTMPNASTFKRNQIAAWQALAFDTAPWKTAAPKVNAFVAAILGDDDAVVIDTWAARAATAGKVENRKRHTINNREYAEIADAYTNASCMTGDSPRDLQAIVWLVIQTQGLAKHSNTFKAGTHPAIIAAFAAEGAE